MKGVTFYAEYPTEAEKRAGGSIFTVLAKTSKWDYQYERGSWADAVTCEYGKGNSRSHFTSTSIEKAYIRKYCRRITESVARSIHPEIFNCGLL